MNGKRNTAERLIKSARSTIETDFTPRYLGFANLTPEQYYILGVYILGERSGEGQSIIAPAKTALTR